MNILNMDENMETKEPDLNHWSEHMHRLQGTNARKVNCGRVYSAYILKPVLSGAEFVNKNRCISVCLVAEEDKSI